MLHLCQIHDAYTLTKFSEKGRPLTTASWARLTFAAATSFIASVIFWVFLTELIRSRRALPLALNICNEADVAAKYIDASKSDLGHGHTVK